MKHIGINKPCPVSREEMTPTNLGAFCHQCTMEVYDFTNKTDEEIKILLSKKLNERVCVRILPAQEEQLNKDFENWLNGSDRSMKQAMLLSLIVAFGFSLFSCKTEEEKAVISQIQELVQHVESKSLQAKSTFVGSEFASRFEKVLPPPPEIEEFLYEIEEEWEERLSEVIIEEEVPEARVDIQEYVLQGDLISSHELYPTYITESVEEVDLDENGIPIPKEYSAIAFPNPTSQISTCKVELPKSGRFTIGIYSMQGELLETIFHGRLKAGTHSFDVNLVDMIPGVYLINISSRKYSQSLRIVKI